MYVPRRTRSTYRPPHLRNHDDRPSGPTSFPSESNPTRRGSFNTEPGNRNYRRGVGRREEPIPFEIAEASAGSGGINFDAYDDVPVEASGVDVPPPAASFAEIHLGGVLQRNIERCRYTKPTPVQRHAMPILIAGRDLMACAQTGSGKTAAFCFPIICGIMKQPPLPPTDPPYGSSAFPFALVLSPTRELANQIYEEAKKFAYQTGVRVVVAYGGTPISQQLRSLERGVEILVATPGRLMDLLERARISLRGIRYLALDEADRMLDMGFEPQIRRIVEQMGMPPPGKRQTMLFSATFPQEIQRLASDFLSNYIFLSVGKVGSSTGLISQRVDFVPDMEKRDYLMNLLHAQRHRRSYEKHDLTLVFVETKRAADNLENWLSRNGFHATSIHGDKTQLERERALMAFRSGRTPIMVATDVAARGLDVPHVLHVINYDLPKGIDSYVHRIGRTGRAGKAGLATAFFSDANLPLAKALAECMDETKQEVPDWLRNYANMTSGYSGMGVLQTGVSRFGSIDYRMGSTSGNQYSTPYGDNNLSRDNYDYQSYSNKPAGNSYDYQRYGDALGGSNAAGENYESQSYSAYPACGVADELQSYGANADKDDSIIGVNYELPQADLGNLQIIPTGWD